MNSLDVIGGEINLFDTAPMGKGGVVTLPASKVIHRLNPTETSLLVVDFDDEEQKIHLKKLSLEETLPSTR